MSDETPTTDRSVASLVLLLALVALGLWEALVPTARPADAPALETEESSRAPVRTVYGLTPVDLGLVAAAVADRRESDDRPTVVSAPPGVDHLEAPVVTRLDRPIRRLPEKLREQLVVEPAGDGWSRLLPDTRDRPLDRLPLDSARVSLRTDGERRPCPRLGPARFGCRAPGWSHVRRNKVRVRGNEESCIWSHPLEGATIVAEFGPLPPRDRPYRLQTALDDRVAGEPGAVDVAIDFGERDLEHRHRAEKGWQTVPLPTGSGPTPLTVAISADQVGRRHFCFRLE